MNMLSMLQVLLIVLLSTHVDNLWAQNRDDTGAEEVADCQGCHSVPDLTSTDPISGVEKSIGIAQEAYDRSAHGGVDCVQCHNYGYAKLPHHGPVSFPRFLCVDCHRKEAPLPRLELDRREKEIRKSAHDQGKVGRLDCHDCHDPHRFQLVRKSKTALERVDVSNHICLTCHGRLDQRLPGYDDLPDSHTTHGRFPDAMAHFRKLKCVICHTPLDGNTRHNVLLVNEALFDCKACHTQDSAVLKANYWIPSDETHDIANENARQSVRENVYVIGSRRTIVLDALSFLGLFILFLVIGAHSCARYWVYRNKILENSDER
ncbi:MAG: hypothetical protein CMM74_10025 [Rhodospirillaceae bacterium]|nr:hypothetical protein [Rhodospirillaceae bacterium]